MYSTLKLIHVASVVVSILGFSVRGMLALRESPVMQQRWVRVVPHINDTVLLSSAIAIATMSGQYPLRADWLTAKVLGLLLYIGLGFIALRGATLRRRRWSFFLAVLMFVWIVSVALSRNPAGFLASLPVAG